MAQSCKQREKILVITPFYPPNIGGAETFCADLVQELSKKYNISVCTIAWGKNKTFAGIGIRQLFEVMPKLAFSAFKAIRRQKPDLLFCIGLNAAFIGAVFNVIWGIRARGVLLALYKFASANPILRAFSAFALNRMDKVFVEGQTGRGDILGLVPENKVKIFQHWCDQEIFYPSPKRNGWKVRVLFVGRPIREKGKHIIQAVQECLKHLKALEFIYVENCRFEDLPKYYQMADICVVPSLYPEGIPRVVIESASCGCAVIASDMGALPEVVNNFGVVCQPTVHEFSYWLETLYKNNEVLRRLKFQSFEYAKKNFSNKNAEVFSCE